MGITAFMSEAPAGYPVDTGYYDISSKCRASEKMRGFLFFSHAMMETEKERENKTYGIYIGIEKTGRSSAVDYDLCRSAAFE